MTMVAHILYDCLYILDKSSSTSAFHCDLNPSVLIDAERLSCEYYSVFMGFCM
jgi:hypothetical protein